MRRIAYIAYFTVSAFAVSGLALAQDPQSAPQSADPSQPALQQPSNNQNHGWRRVDDPAPAATAADPQDSQSSPAQAPPAAPNSRPNYYPGQPAPPPSFGTSSSQTPNYQGPPPNYQGAPPNYQQGAQQAPPPLPPIPASLTLKPGTYITVRVNQVLSSDHNQPGDAFSATLVKPVVVNGIVVAERGQTIGGRVAEAKKAGKIEGTSKLGVQLTDLTLADGQNIPITSQFVSRTGSTSVGRDAGAVAGTTAVGAVVGSAVDWGRGAAIGAGAGAAAGLIGVLLTRGRPTLIYPEQVLTFRLETPVTISTERAPLAFRYVEPGDYQQAEMQRRPPPTMRVAGPPAYYGPGYYSPYYPYPYPYMYGPGLGLGIGFYGGGFYRGWRR